jgi:hypothetical protein
LERRLADAYKREAINDPAAWQAKSEGERLQAAAGSAAKELIGEARRKKVRLAQTIIAHDRMRNFVASQLAGGFDKNGFAAVGRMLASKADGKNNILSVEDISRGIESNALGDLFEVWEAVHKNFADIIAGALGRESQTALEGLLIRALHGEDVGRPEIMKAADAFHQVAERLRTRFNAAGGEIGKLDNWGLPHSWSAERASEFHLDGHAKGQDSFVAAMFPLLDRSRYVHEDGVRYSDAEMQGFLANAWLSITTDGANKPLSEVRQSGAVIGRHAEARQIHFLDGDSAHKAFAHFSKAGALDAMASHVKRMSRDIALVEQFGPNPELAVAKVLEELHQAYRLAAPGKFAQTTATLYSRQVEHLYDYLSGNTEAPLQVPLFRAFGWESKYTVGEAFQDIRNLAVASKLGSAFIPSIVDEATMHLTAQVNGISHTRLFFNELHTLNLADRTERRIAGRQGLLVHTMLDELNRWGSQNLGRRKTGKIASTVVRASGLNAITEARRRAFSLTMMDTLGAMTRSARNLASLDATDRTYLQHTGITDEHWAIWKLAQPESWRGNDTVLNAQSIYRIPDDAIRAKFGDVNAKLLKDRAASALMGFVLREQDTAVITPGVREQAMMNFGVRPGTWKGELMRSFFLFKSFPIAMISRHLGRVFSQDTNAGRVMYGTALIAATTVLGAIAIEMTDLRDGRDPRSLNPSNKRGKGNILAGFLKGGALGIYGDLIFANPADYGQSYTGQLLGPVFGLMESTAQLTLANMNQAARGEKTDASAELIRIGKGMTPFANLWYTKAATDHLIFQRMQDYFSPGYLGRMKAKAQRDYGSTYWWEPGAHEPERAPDLSTAVQK